MTTYLPRSAWGARPPKSPPKLLVGTDVLGSALHWPGMGSRQLITQEQVASALRGWQDYHMDGRGWNDIAYQVAVDQAGRAWDLRGLTTRSAANGDATVNLEYGAILLILGSGEPPTAALINTTRNVIADFRRYYPKGTAIKPHSAVRPSTTGEPSTDCPGDAARHLIAIGAFNPVPTPTPAKDLDMYTETQLRAMMQAEIEEYMKRFWAAPTGTGTAIRAQLDRIEMAVKQ